MGSSDNQLGVAISRHDGYNIFIREGWLIEMVGWVQIACEMLAGFMIGPINAWMQSCMPEIGGWVRGLLEGAGCV